MADLFLAFDFGGTKLTAVLTDTDHITPGQQSWLDLRRAFSPPDADAHYDITTMMQLGRDLLGSGTPAAVGVSFGGPVDYAAGTVRLSHHVPGWENTPLQAMLEAEFGVPVRVDNDANVAALGESHFGAGRGCDSLFYITVSTGVGGGWILNGKPWRGHESMAGEIGHTVVDPQGPICLCGKRGCVERLASGPYMAQDLAGMQGSGGAGERVTGKDVAELALAGDVAARRILQRGAQALGVGIGNAANLVNPGLFVLGGGVTKSGELWWQTVRQTARETAMPEVHFAIVPAELGDEAPLWGAVALLSDE
jgi:glucokinase